jgi:hypothetical protein
MHDLHIPDLTFPMIKYGKRETLWDLRPLLYMGGAGVNLRNVGNLLAKDALGNPIMSRLPLVEKLHDVIAGRLVGGRSRHTVRSNIDSLRKFYTWAEDAGRSLTLEMVESMYIDWTDHLLHRVRIVGDINILTVRMEAARVARMLDEVLDLRVGLLCKSRVRVPSSRRARTWSPS